MRPTKFFVLASFALLLIVSNSNAARLRSGRQLGAQQNDIQGNQQVNQVQVPQRRQLDFPSSAKSMLIVGLLFLLAMLSQSFTAQKTGLVMNPDTTNVLTNILDDSSAVVATKPRFDVWNTFLDSGREIGSFWTLPEQPSWYDSFFERNGLPDTQVITKTTSEFNEDDWNMLAETYVKKNSISGFFKNAFQSERMLMDFVLDKDEDGDLVLKHPFLLEVALRTNKLKPESLARLLPDILPDNQERLYSQNCVALFEYLLGQTSSNQRSLVDRDGHMSAALCANPFFSEQEILQVMQKESFLSQNVMETAYINNRPSVFTEARKRALTSHQLGRVLNTILSTSAASPAQIRMAAELMDALASRPDLSTIIQNAEQDSRSEVLKMLYESDLSAQEFAERFGVDVQLVIMFQSILGGKNA